MEEQPAKTLRELAAELVGQKPGELLNFALYPGGVTLIGKDGRKARLHWQPLVGWQVDEVTPAAGQVEALAGEAGQEQPRQAEPPKTIAKRAKPRGKKGAPGPGEGGQR